MKNRSGTSYFFLFGSILLFAGILWAQNAPDRALIVNGKSEGMVVQMGGHAYVDVETVAQFTNGSVTLEPNRIVLIFPPPGTSAAPSTGLAPLPPAPPPGLSRNFASLAIAELAEMREWRGAVGTILTYGVPVVGTWPQDYRDLLSWRSGLGLTNRGRRSLNRGSRGCLLWHLLRVRANQTDHRQKGRRSLK